MNKYIFFLGVIFLLKSCQLLEKREKQAIDICKNSKIQFAENNLFQYLGLSNLGLSQESKWSEFANSIAKDNPNSKYKWAAREIGNSGVFIVSFTDETNWGQNWEVSLDDQIVKHINSNEYLSRKYGFSRLDPDSNFKIGEVKEKILKKERKYDYLIGKNTSQIVFSLRGFLVNNTDKNITNADISGSLSLVFDNKVVESNDVWESGFKRKITKSTPWKPKEKIEFDLKTKGLEDIYLEYDPEYVVFTINLSAEDPVGFTFDKAIEEIDLMEDWINLNGGKIGVPNNSGEKQSTKKEKNEKSNSIKGLENEFTEIKKLGHSKPDSSNKGTKPAKSEAEKIAQGAPEQSKIDQRAIFGAGGISGRSTSSVSNSVKGYSDTNGDERPPTGTVDKRAVMVEGSGKEVKSGAGFKLDLAGWEFASLPNINDLVSTRDGRIVFSIKVDENGRVVQAAPLEFTVSNDVLAYYRQVVNQINFKKSGGAAADFSTGKITFVIKVD